MSGGQEPTDQDPGLTYAAVGVDIRRKAEAIRRMAALTAGTQRAGVLSNLGSFGGMFRLDVKQYPVPVLVSSADGVGSKLKLAFRTGIHDTVGIDLVAMNVDDIAVQGAEPLFFLDYIGISKVDETVLAAIVQGVAEGCRQAGCALIGGETAELPDLYAAGEYDLAGFCVGVVNQDQVVDGSRVTVGDAVIGLASSGLHSNGYTLARRVLLRADGGAFDLADRPLELGGRTVAEEMLAPTRIYAPALLALRRRVTMKAAAHITGGGFGKNIPRVLPAGYGVDLVYSQWPHPPVFDLIQRLGRISDTEMERTFNLGLGMVVVVPREEQDQAVEAARDMGMDAFPVGTVVPRTGVQVLR